MKAFKPKQTEASAIFGSTRKEGSKLAQPSSPSSHLGWFSQGTDVQIANLVQLNALATRLPLRKQKKILNQMAGHHSSSIRGRGIDYSEVREYQAGDDIRSMDWRVTARTGTAHIKLFAEEKERPVIIICDLRNHMRFATRRAFKQVLAADLTALLGWATLAEGDRIGALLFDDTTEVDIRPKTGRKSLLGLLNQLALFAAAPEQSPQSSRVESIPAPTARFADICSHLRRIAKPGSSVYFISDWYGFDKTSEHQLFEVCRHCDLTAIHLFDPIEATPPPPGQYEVTDGENRGWLNSRSSKNQNAHKQAFTGRIERLNQRLNQLKAPFISLSTADDPLAALRQGMGLDMGTSK